MNATTSNNNPFYAHREVFLRGGYTAAERLQQLVRHLYNPARFPVELSAVLRGCDNHHRKIALDALQHYAQHGEADPIFMHIAERITANH